MERLKMMKDTLVSCAQGQMGDLKSVDAEELGEVIDMIKDLEEAIYYCTVTKAMEDYGGDTKYYPSRMMEPYRDMDRDMGKMYYSSGRGGGMGNSSSGSGRGNSSSSSYYTEPEMYPMHIHDFREGRSALSRKSYMESKELHADKDVHMKELEKYLRELSEDITEMIQDASPEEKSMLQQKITTLAQKIK